MSEAFKELGVTDLKQVSERRLGEVWASFVRSDEWFSDWVKLIRLVISLDIDFKDCRSSEDLLELDMTSHLYKIPDEYIRAFNLRGPTAIMMYDHVTLDDLRKALPGFNVGMRATLRSLLEELRPEALEGALKDL